ncbi:hypothetical protein BIU89_02550 [Curtobacterium sp. MCBA15_005]|nr:hypothetical protein BIU89_02550 [Curtobacterium sp. MCBA15_005]
MFTWGVFDFDIIDSEMSIASRLADVLEAPNQQLQTSASIINAIVQIFFDAIDDDSDALSRLRLSEEARGFYSMFLDWKRQAFPLKRMIRSFLRYWEDSPAALIWVGASWGDTKRTEDEHLFSYVRKSAQTRAKLVNLAVARIKDESDFVSFRLMRYIEVLDQLGYITPSASSEIRYGTDDPWMVRLLRSGMSVELVRLLRDEYRRFVQVDVKGGDFELLEELIGAMERDSVNGVLLYEARSWIHG